jgi:hypothetical protein
MTHWTTHRYAIDCDDPSARATVDVGPLGSGLVRIQIDHAKGRQQLPVKIGEQDNWKKALSSMHIGHWAFTAWGYRPADTDFKTACQNLERHITWQCIRGKIGSMEQLEEVSTVIAAYIDDYEKGQFGGNDKPETQRHEDALNHLLVHLGAVTDWRYGSEQELNASACLPLLQSEHQAFLDEIWLPFREQLDLEFRAEAAPAPSARI